MRLTCPNCGAQYEVPDQVIPEEGRDVQCSNCGMTWFQAHPDNPHPEAHPPDVEDVDQDEAPDTEERLVEHPEDHREDHREVHWEESGETEPDSSLTLAAQETSQETSPEPEEFADEPESEDWTSEEEDRSDDTSASQARPGIDIDVADVLREEAEREVHLRAEENAGGLESQPELGLDNEPDDAWRRAEEARARMARLRGDASASQPAGAEPDPDPENVSRRGLLPDIEEINSSLKSSTAVAPALPRSEADDPDQTPPRSGFSRGFALVLLLGVALLLIYTNASRISAAVPQADPVLNVYVAAIDNARTWLNQQLANLTPKS